MTSKEALEKLYLNNFDRALNLEQFEEVEKQRQDCHNKILSDLEVLKILKTHLRYVKVTPSKSNDGMNGVIEFEYEPVMISFMDTEDEGFSKIKEWLENE